MPFWKSGRMKSHFSSKWTDAGRLAYWPLLARPDKIYGTKIGSSYQRRAFQLSKHSKSCKEARGFADFQPWKTTLCGRLQSSSAPINQEYSAIPALLYNQS